MKTKINSAVVAAPRDEVWLKRHAECVTRAQLGGIDVLFLGDSLTDWWSDPAKGGPVWDRYFAELKAVNFGISADRTQHILWRLRHGEADGYSPKVVVLLIGTNNTGMEKDGRTPRNTPEEAIQGVSAILEELRRRFGTTKVLLLGLFPRDEKASTQREQIVQINNALAKLDGHHHIFYLDIGKNFLDEKGHIRTDLMPDSVHLSTKGYQVFAQAIVSLLESLRG